MDNEEIYRCLLNVITAECRRGSFIFKGVSLLWVYFFFLTGCKVGSKLNTLFCLTQIGIVVEGMKLEIVLLVKTKLASECSIWVQPSYSQISAALILFLTFYFWEWVINVFAFFKPLINPKDQQISTAGSGL